MRRAEQDVHVRRGAHTVEAVGALRNTGCAIAGDMTQLPPARRRGAIGMQHVRSERGVFCGVVGSGGIVDLHDRVTGGDGLLQIGVTGTVGLQVAFDGIRRELAIAARVAGLAQIDRLHEADARGLAVLVEEHRRRVGAAVCRGAVQGDAAGEDGLAEVVFRRDRGIERGCRCGVAAERTHLHAAGAVYAFDGTSVLCVFRTKLDAQELCLERFTGFGDAGARK